MKDKVALISLTKLLKAISKDPYLLHVFNQADISNKPWKYHFGRHPSHIPTILDLFFLIKHRVRRNKFLLTAISYHQQLDSYFPPSCVMQIIRPSCICFAWWIILSANSWMSYIFMACHLYSRSRLSYNLWGTLFSLAYLVFVPKNAIEKVNNNNWKIY